MNKNLIVTCALPYANGPIHLGHMLEHIQADIWVRFHKMQPEFQKKLSTCYFICADDTHGTPIMLQAERLAITPEELIATAYKDHLADFTAFNIDFDHYYTTNSEECKSLVYDIYQKLQQNNKITKKIINQLFDNEKQIFLPDRFVKGSCPKCKATDQYGDNCEVCGATYSPKELINPYSTISGSIPIIKDTEHYFFKLSECINFLQEWLNTPRRLPTEAKNKMQEWLNKGLQDWDISRDKPYFGFPLPDNPDKYFYVWLDAPVGYLGSFLNYCKINNLDFHSILNLDNTEIYHFIGKDILYFHALFWPSVLNFSGYKTPKSIFPHGFLTINGAKMSKSRGTFITANKYRSTQLNPDFYRYYIASKLSQKIEDMDFVLDDFVAKINSELIGKYINIAARSSSFINKLFNNRLTSDIHDYTLLHKIIKAKDNIAKCYFDREYGKAIKIIMSLADEINTYIDLVKPWELAKRVKNDLPIINSLTSKEQPDLTSNNNSNNNSNNTNNIAIKLHEICSILINTFRILSIYLKPVIPGTINKVENLLNIKSLTWEDLDILLLNHEIKTYFHIIKRVEQSEVQELINKESSI